MATYSSIFAWEIPWAEEAWQATVHGVTKVSDMTYQLSNDNTWDTCTPIADSCQCMAKATTILYSNKPPIKINTILKEGYYHCI